MTVHFIGAGPGAADLITVRGRDLLARCPICLYAGSLVPKALLAYCLPGTRLVDTAPLDCDAIEEEFIAADAAGHDVSRLHPCGLSTWSAMSEQIRRLEARGIPYTVTPGIPAYAAAAAALGRELTMPKISQSIVLTRVLNNSPTMPAGERLETFAATGATLVIHFSIHALNEVAARLIPFYGPACPAAVVFRASLPDERVVRGTLATLSDQLLTTQIERTAVLVVGPSLAAGEYSDRELYSLHFDRKFRRAVEYD